MALFKYFKPTKPSETVSTEEKQTLSVREKDSVVDELRKVEENKEKRSKYRVWTPAQRAKIGKHAADHGNASAVKANLHASECQRIQIMRIMFFRTH